MAGSVTIKQGECLASIAKRYGFADYKQIYNHPNNAAFRKKRPNPNVLCPGDSLYIPDLDPKTLDKSADQGHKFVLKKSTTRLRLVIQDEDGAPRDSVDYQLHLPGATISAVTGTDGLIEQDIPADLEEVTLQVKFQVGTAVVSQRWILKTGHLDPAEEPAGIQARLTNLGFDCGPVDGVIGPKTRAAVRRFQEWARLEVDGIAGPITQAKLQSRHGC